MAVLPLFSENVERDNITWRMERYAREDYYRALHLWLIAGNPGCSCFSVEAYQRGEQPEREFAIDNHTERCRHGRKWRLLGLEMIQVFCLETDREPQCIRGTQGFDGDVFPIWICAETESWRAEPTNAWVELVEF